MLSIITVLENEMIELQLQKIALLYDFRISRINIYLKPGLSCNQAVRGYLIDVTSKVGRHRHGRAQSRNLFSIASPDLFFKISHFR